MIRRPPRSTLFPTRRSSDLRLARLRRAGLPCHASPDGAGSTTPEPGIAASLQRAHGGPVGAHQDRKSTRLNSSHANMSYAVFCLKTKETFFRDCVYVKVSDRQ